MKTASGIALTVLAVGQLFAGPQREAPPRMTTPGEPAISYPQFELRPRVAPESRAETASKLNEPRRDPEREATTSLVFRPEVSGVIPRAIRGGQPLQMLDPFTPVRYWTAEENVALDPDVPGKGNGIKLFSFSF